MSDYFINSPFVAAGPVTATHSTPQAPLGIEVDGIDRNFSTASGGGAGRFVYCRGSNVASAGQFVHIQNGSAVLLASANASLAFPVGCCPTVLSATNVYGWVQVQGRVDYATHTNTGVTAGIPQYIGATAGQLVSNAAAGQRVQGVAVPYNQTATATNLSYVYDLNRPFIVGASAAL